MMKHLIHIGSGSLVLIVLTSLTWLGYVSILTSRETLACSSNGSTVSESSQFAQSFQEALQSYSTDHGEVGLQAALILPDGRAVSASVGQAEHARRCPLHCQHSLYIGSISKLYTAALTMDQVEQGRLSLQDTIDNWFDLPYSQEITIEMLLNHTSGIPSYTENLSFLAQYMGLPGKDWQPWELIGMIPPDHLFPPGSQHEYSNSNYLLLGVILEEITGVDYGSLLQIFLSHKLSLEHTFFTRSYSKLPVASAYDTSLLKLGRRNLTGLRKSLQSGGYSAGGILSNADEVAYFVHAVFSGQLVSQSTLDKMLNFVEAPDEDVPQQIGYGLGIRNLVIDGQNLVGHTGTIPGYSGIAMHNPQKGYTLVILSNQSVIDQAGLYAELQKEVLKE